MLNRSKHVFYNGREYLVLPSGRVYTWQRVSLSGEYFSLRRVFLRCLVKGR